MSDLRQALADYLTVRRALGHRLQRTEKLLGQFVADLEARGASTITVENAVAWATAPAGSRGWWAIRISAARGFARYLHTRDQRSQPPPREVLGPRPRRRVPHLYTDRELEALLQATATLSCPFRAATVRTLIGLLAVTGMRVGEAIAADSDDLDPEAALLLVRHGKYGKQRLLPLHPTTLRALRAYLDRPDRPERPGCPALFVSMAGTRLCYQNVVRTFITLRRRAGLEAARRRPHIHDLRHSFAVRTLLDWHRDGSDVDARLPQLSTYLGHVDPASTYWYLTGAPELLPLAGRRLEAWLGEVS